MLKYKLSSIELLYIIFLIIIVAISCFHYIPTEAGYIGISSPKLSIGDRSFYINESNLGYGGDGIKGNILYPLILKGITNISRVLGGDQYSSIWNSITISITSLFSIISLRMLKLSSLGLFNKNVSSIACILYVINPYTYFYSITGGITNYMILGVTSILYLFCKCYRKSKGLNIKNNSKYISAITFLCVYLSLLRPSGILFSLIILLFILYKLLSEAIKSGTINFIKSFNISIVMLGIIITVQNLYDSWGYSMVSVKLFAMEGNNFFGYPRDQLRQALGLMHSSVFEKLKGLIYLSLWKLTDFISGLSDIRDTHSSIPIESILPFIARTFTGIFILYPINLLSFLGILLNRKIIISSDIWVIILACLVSISPSIIGVAMSRYLIMFYTPFLIFAAKLINDILSYQTNID